MEADMLHAAGSALLIILDPHRLIYLFAGVCMGLGLGLLPGIGGIAGTALMLPFTYDLDPHAAFALLLGLALLYLGAAIGGVGAGGLVDPARLPDRIPELPSGGNRHAGKHAGMDAVQGPEVAAYGDAWRCGIYQISAWSLERS